MSIAQVDLTAGTSEQPLRFKRRWILFVTVGEAVGFLVPAATGTLTASPSLERWQVPLLILAGIVEGALLGAAQALAARRFRRPPPLWGWIGTTALGAAIAWSCGLGISAIAQSAAPVAAVIVAAVVLGLTGLVAMPTLQYLTIRRTIPRSALWIPVNAGAWAVGIGWTFLPSPFIDETTPMQGLIVAYALAGLFMATTVAALTAPLARRLFATIEAPSAD
ncbi:hypothetical protein [Lacisediminihabitans profunda]|uniref:Uncharacterized protein n=1 Tax=Lacisediminihabitans profunda TaxID=2594790 RepID=A0A5C8UIV7_9MICO|nr:hypothetical protein [Lacisediminihabitans profunda]TXN28086.1 hypothetical protein FVP33_18225 [Lacisediminihabitans profunda]